MKKWFLLSFLLLNSIAVGAIADDPDCVRNNCLGTCISKQEALGKRVPMFCKPQYVCYKDVECVKLDNGKCGWKETPQMKACITEKTKAVTPVLPAPTKLP